MRIMRKFSLFALIIIFLMLSSCSKSDTFPNRNGYGATIDEALYNLQYENNVVWELEKDLSGTYFNLKNPFSNSFSNYDYFYQIGSVTQYEKYGVFNLTNENSSLGTLTHYYYSPATVYNSEERYLLYVKVSSSDLRLHNINLDSNNYDVRYERKFFYNVEKKDSPTGYTGYLYDIYFDIDGKSYLGASFYTSHSIYNLAECENLVNPDNASEEIKYYLNIMEQEFQRFLKNAEMINLKIEK